MVEIALIVVAVAVGRLVVLDDDGGRLAREHDVGDVSPLQVRAASCVDLFLDAVATRWQSWQMRMRLGDLPDKDCLERIAESARSGGVEQPSEDV